MRVRAGDPSAFGALFDAHAAVIYRHAVRITGDWALAEDVVSLTFLEAWRLRARLNPVGDSLRPWLLGIATNVLRNISRAARRHRHALSRVPVHETVPDFSDDLVGRVVDAEELAAAHAALATLRPREREVLALCVWEGLDYQAAALALGVPVGTVRSRLSRARTRLREATQSELTAVRSQTRPAATSVLAATFAMEPANPHGQITGDRGSAVRSTQEDKR